MTMASDITNALASVRSSYGATATYFRDANSVSVAVAVGSQDFEHDDGDGFMQTIEMRDYLIAAADLIISGSVIEPIPGDQIKEVNGETTFVYEVASPYEGRPCFDYSDPGRSTLRIHTKLTGTE